MSQDFTLQDKALKQLMKAFKTMPMARLGVLEDSGKNGRTDTATNATIAAAHEYGTSKLPVRSFLRMPINEKMNEYLMHAGAFDKKKLQEVIATGSLIPWVRKIGVIGEQIVSDAFNSAGFGKWKPSNMDEKSVKQTLVETQQLRNSITSDVK